MPENTADTLQYEYTINDLAARFFFFGSAVVTGKDTKGWKVASGTTCQILKAIPIF